MATTTTTTPLPSVGAAVYFRSAVDGWRSGSFMGAVGDIAKVKDADSNHTYSVRLNALVVQSDADRDALADALATKEWDLVRDHGEQPNYAALTHALRTRFYRGQSGAWLGSSAALWLPRTGGEASDAPTSDGDDTLYATPGYVDVVRRAVLTAVVSRRTHVVASVGQRHVQNWESVMSGLASVCTPLSSSMLQQVSAARTLLGLFVDASCAVNTTFYFQYRRMNTVGCTFSVALDDVAGFCDRDGPTCIVPHIFGHEQFGLEEGADLTPVLAETEQTAERYQRIAECLVALNIRQAVRDTLYRLIAAVWLLHLSTSDDKSNKEDGAPREEGETTVMNEQERLAKLDARVAHVLGVATLGDLNTTRRDAMSVVYRVLVQYLVYHINLALRPLDAAEGSVVQVALIDASVAEMGVDVNPTRTPAALFRNIVVEDAWQAFVQSFEVAAVGLEKEGVRVGDFDAEVDTFDNYALLKVMKGKGGILELLSLTTNVLETGRDINHRYRRHPKLDTSRCEKASPDVAEVCIKHLLGPVTYDLSRWTSVVDGRVCAEIHSMLSHSKAEGVVDAVGMCTPQSLGTQWTLEMQGIAATLCDPRVSKLWFLSVAPTGSADDAESFSGVGLEAQLRSIGLVDIIRTFRTVGTHTLPVPYDIIAAQFRCLVPGATRSTPRDVTEEACRLAGVTGTEHTIGRTQWMSQPLAIVKLHRALVSYRHSCAALVQSYARAWVSFQMNIAIRAMDASLRSSQALSSSLLAVSEGDVEAMRELSRKAQREQMLNSVMIHEGRQRAEVSSTERVERVALQTSYRELRKALVHAEIVSSLEEQKSVERAFEEMHTASQRRRRATAEEQMAERLAQRGSRLDLVLARRLEMEKKSEQRHQRAHTGKQKLLNRKLSDVQRRIQVEAKIEEKEKRKESVLTRRKSEVEQRQYDRWLVSERDKELRLQRQRLEEMWIERQRENIRLDQIEAEMERRLETELRDHLRKKREQQRIENDMEMERQKTLIERLEKKQTFKKFKEEKVLSRLAQREQTEQRRKAHAAWQVDNEQRKIREEMIRKEEAAKKRAARQHLRQEQTLSTPMVYEVAVAAAARSVSRATSSQQQQHVTPEATPSRHTLSPRVTHATPRAEARAMTPFGSVGSPRPGTTPRAQPTSLSLTKTSLVHSGVWDGLLERHSAVSNTNGNVDIDSPQSPGAFSL